MFSRDKRVYIYISSCVYFSMKLVRKSTMRSHELCLLEHNHLHHFLSLSRFLLSLYPLLYLIFKENSFFFSVQSLLMPRTMRRISTFVATISFSFSFSFTFRFSFSLWWSPARFSFSISVSFTLSVAIVIIPTQVHVSQLSYFTDTINFFIKFKNFFCFFF